MQTHGHLMVRNTDELSQLLKVAITKHAAGELQSAGDIYRRMLQRSPKHVLATHNLGLILLQNGKTDAAIRYFESALAQKPDYPEAACNLGTALKMQGRLDEAVESFKRAVKLKPDYAAAWCNLAITSNAVGDTKAALDAYKISLQLDPNNLSARCSLAQVLYSTEKFDEAAQQYQYIIENRPNEPDSFCDLGNALLALGKAEAAIEAYDRALHLDPALAEIYCNIANAFEKQGKIDEAITACKKTVNIKPTYAEGHYNLANLLVHKGHYEEALAAYQNAINLKPDYIHAYHNMGSVLGRLEKYEQAIHAYKQAIRIEPTNVDAHINLGNSLSELNRLQESEACYEKAIAKGLNDPRLYYGLGNVLKNRGLRPEAIDAYKRSIDLRKDFTEAHLSLARAFEDEGEIAKALSVQNRACETCEESAILNNFSFRMFAMNGIWDLAACLAEKVIQTNFKESELDLFSRSLFVLNAADVSADTLYAKHKEWGELQMARCRKETIRFTFDNPKRRNPKIGYLSPDFRRHSVGYFFREIIKKHDTDAFPIYCYSLLEKEDDITSEIEGRATVYRRVAHLRSEDIARQIAEDGIDILVDLAGHTIGNRIEILGYKPAPIQVTAIGYPNGTGLPTVNYRLTDRNAESTEADEHYVENLVRLERCFLPFIRLEVSDRSFSKEDFGLPPHGIAMASFNALHKLNPFVLNVWNKILNAQPDAYLLLSFKNVQVKALRDNILSYFKENSNRIVFLPRAETQEIHRARYRVVDLVLDTFPYAGTTTSYEALYMGVPMVTLVGERHVQRTTYSFLKNMGIFEGAAFNEEEYIQMALSFATDIGLRERVKEKIRKGVKLPELSAKAYTETLEDTYMTMWSHHQSGSRPTGFNIPGKPNHRATPQAGIIEIMATNSQNPYNDPKLNLHIGGKVPHPDWKILNIIPEEGVDFIGDAKDLGQFIDESIQNIYASHVLEHLALSEITPCLKEWHRVLAPDGLLLISVPNLSTLCELFASGECDPDNRFLIIKMIMGSQKNPYDFHRSAFDMDLICHFLAEAGFQSISEVESHGIFKDCGEIYVRGRRISLNVIVRKQPA